MKIFGKSEMEIGALIHRSLGVDLPAATHIDGGGGGGGVLRQGSEGGALRLAKLAFGHLQTLVSERPPIYVCIISSLSEN